MAHVCTFQGQIVFFSLTPFLHLRTDGQTNQSYKHFLVYAEMCTKATLLLAGAANTVYLVQEACKRLAQTSSRMPRMTWNMSTSSPVIWIYFFKTKILFHKWEFGEASPWPSLVCVFLVLWVTIILTAGGPEGSLGTGLASQQDNGMWDPACTLHKRMALLNAWALV